MREVSPILVIHVNGSLYNYVNLNLGGAGQAQLLNMHTSYRIAGIFRGVKFSWMFKFSSIRGLMFVVCDVHDHTCLKL